MAAAGVAKGPSDRSSASFSSNNPFRRTPQSTETQRQQQHQQSLDSEKQVASSEVLSGPGNAPTPVEPTPSSPVFAEPTRDAGMEVTSSWQTQSREQSAPISMAYHESNSATSPRSREDAFFADMKGPPPAYGSLNSRHSSSSGAESTPLATPTSLEPDPPTDLPPPRPEDRNAVSQLLSWIPPAPRRPSQPARLAQPVAIPQLDVPPMREQVPFQRCYSDALASHGVSMADFTRFLDGLEAAQLPSAALQSLRMVGVGVSHFPVPVLNLMTGRGLMNLAGSGSGHSGTRARLYLEQARERYFAPRGLRVTIVKNDDLEPRLQIPAHVPRLGMLTQNTLSATCCQRRLEALGPYTAPLRFDVPEQDKQIAGVQKVARKHLKSRLQLKAKKVDVLRQKQWMHTSLAAASWDEKYRDKLSEVRNAQYDLIREAVTSTSPREKGSAEEALRLRQHELQLIVSERQNQGRDDEAVAAEMEEVARCRRLRWLVVESV